MIVCKKSLIFCLCGNIFFLLFFVFVFSQCETFSNNSQAKNHIKCISYFTFDSTIEDQYSRAEASVYPTGVLPVKIITYVDGIKGKAVRSSHNMEDGGGDFEISHYKNGWPESKEIYISYYLKFENGYDKALNEGALNFKQFWSLGQEGHQEIILQNIDSSGVSFSWLISGNAGWDAGTEIVKYSERLPYIRNEWMHLELYIKQSGGDSCTYADGICWLKLNGREVFYGDNVITNVTGAFRCPALKASGDCGTGKGWWQIDEYEMWNGLP
jgi:hypothetical protein